MQRLKEHLNAKNFEETEETADSILKMMGEKLKPLVLPLARVAIPGVTTAGSQS